MDHLKPYVGENSPFPWVDTEGKPIEQVEPETSISFHNQNDLEGLLSTDLSAEMSDLLFPEDEIIEYEEPGSLNEHAHTPGVKSPVRTRAGRAIKPRDIYSP